MLLGSHSQYNQEHKVDLDTSHSPCFHFLLPHNASEKGQTNLVQGQKAVSARVVIEPANTSEKVLNS